jgi:hypothetical protein
LLVSGAQVEIAATGMRWNPGSLAVVDTHTRASRVLYPQTATRPARSTWGDSACPGEIGPALSPHGMHLSQRADGRRQLLVVNHGGRESIEFFELSGRGRTLALHWRGCVAAPEPGMLNDVVALPRGGLLVTRMTRSNDPDAMMRDRSRAERGEATGDVWRWRRDEGFSRLAGGSAPMPNGIQVDARGKYAYLNLGTSTGGVRKIDLATGEAVGFAAIANPDNSSWTREGRLLIAGLTQDADVAPCVQATFAVPCGARSYVASIDPSTLAIRTVFEHAGPPMGLATVAVQADGYLYLGSAAGDRILRVPLPAGE